MVLNARSRLQSCLLGSLISSFSFFFVISFYISTVITRLFLSSVSLEELLSEKMTHVASSDCLSWGLECLQVGKKKKSGLQTGRVEFAKIRVLLVRGGLMKV